MELGLLHSPLCTGPTRRELGSQEFCTGLQDHRRYKLQSETQKKQNYVTPKVTRWQKASTRTLPTKTKATWHHQKPVLPPQQVLDN